MLEVVKSPWIISESWRVAIWVPMVSQTFVAFGNLSRCSESFLPLMNCISIFSLSSVLISSGTGIILDIFSRIFASFFVLLFLILLSNSGIL